MMIMAVECFNVFVFILPHEINIKLKNDMEFSLNGCGFLCVCVFIMCPHIFCRMLCAKLILVVVVECIEQREI